ncbi:MAG TPA: flagellar filament capping protein FliD, partial [Gemmataceae bacterium]|nr:flagellar filament capping protein FliD [Gemmataceae bacterium]
IPLLTLQSQLGTLSQTQNSVFDLRSVASSNTDLLTAAASSSATPGTYTMSVVSLAAANQIATQGLTSANSSISQGSITVSSGGSSVTLAIDSTNDTLQGLANAINNAGIGVSAGIINDGSGANPFRLVLAAAKTGTDNAVTITNNLGPDSGAAVKPLFDTILQQAANAAVTLGSGAGAITVQSASNQIDGMIAGVTLNLLGADANKPITVTIANDTAKASDAIQTFVKDFNDLMQFIDDQVKFDSTSGQAGVLLGNFQATQIQDQLRTVVGGLVKNVNPKMNRLGALGITFTDNGQLAVDSDKLTNALSGQLSGVTLNDIQSLFALTGASSSPNVQFVTGSSKTKAAATPYQVAITQAALQATVTATNALAASTVIDNTNQIFGLSVDGIASGAVTLAPGTYTPTELAQELQKEINAQAALGGRQVSVGVAGGNLTITSNTYGSKSTVTLGAGSALADLGFTGAETATGQNVAGSFVVNGVTELASGSGQLLTGTSTNANTADLQVRVLMTPAQVGGGVQTDMTVTRGLASLLDAALTSLLDPVNGRMKSIDDGFQTTEDNIGKEIDRQTASFAAKQQALAQQFIDMEQAISKLQTLGNYLTTQFAQQQQQKN